MMFYFQELELKKTKTFKQQIGNFVRKCSTYKFHRLRRIRKSLTTEKFKILGNVYMDNQFNYASLLRMLCRKTPYSKLGKIYHKTLKVMSVSNDS